MKYDTGVVSGKFRVFHKGHEEVILKAAKENIQNLVVIIHANRKYKRYSTMDDLIDIIDYTLRKTTKDYKIIITEKIFNTTLQWEEFVIKSIGHKNIIMYNSKENYKNILLDNKYIRCDSSSEISASSIEKDLICGIDNKYIVEEFKTRIIL